MTVQELVWCEVAVILAPICLMAIVFCGIYIKTTIGGKND